MIGRRKPYVVRTRAYVHFAHDPNNEYLVSVDEAKIGGWCYGRRWSADTKKTEDAFLNLDQAYLVVPLKP